GTNVIEVGQDNVILLGKSEDHVIIPEKVTITQVAYFDVDNDILHIESNVEDVANSVSSPVETICVDTPQGAEICTGNQTIQLHDVRCAELKPENIKINDSESVAEARSKTLSRAQTPNLTATATMSFALGALYTAAPQFVKDVLQAKGMNQNQAEWV